MTVNQAEVGNFFREIREGNLLSASELAEQAGVPVAYIVGLELGWTGVTIEEMQRIASVLGLTMDEVEDACKFA